MAALTIGDTWVCSCGNTAEGDGFEPCVDMGWGWVVCEPTPRRWPRPSWMCLGCGSVFEVADPHAVGVVFEIIGGR